jgi:ribosomal protein L18
MDKDVAFIYTKFITYYAAKNAGKKVAEPEVTSQLKQDLIDDILNIIDLREEMRADIQYIDNQNYTSGGRVFSSLASLYAMAFKRLEQSAKTWRKRNGQKGYLNYVQSFL